jgi:uncharacterized membrane protein
VNAKRTLHIRENWRKIAVECRHKAGAETMKALILYIGLVVIGAVLAALLGVYLEKSISSTVSLVVFLTCFFLNFAVSWLIVIYIMDGSLKKSGA